MQSVTKFYSKSYFFQTTYSTVNFLTLLNMNPRNNKIIAEKHMRKISSKKLNIPESKLKNDFMKIVNRIRICAVDILKIINEKRQRNFQKTFSLKLVYRLYEVHSRMFSI